MIEFSPINFIIFINLSRCYRSISIIFILILCNEGNIGLSKRDFLIKNLVPNKFRIFKFFKFLIASTNFNIFTILLYEKSTLIKLGKLSLSFSMI